MEIGGVGEDGELGFFGPNRGGEAPEPEVDAGDVARDLEEADHGQVFGADDRARRRGLGGRVRACGEN